MKSRGAWVLPNRHRDQISEMAISKSTRTMSGDQEAKRTRSLMAVEITVTEEAYRNPPANVGAIGMSVNALRIFADEIEELNPEKLARLAPGADRDFFAWQGQKLVATTREVASWLERRTGVVSFGGAAAEGFVVSRDASAEPAKGVSKGLTGPLRFRPRGRHDSEGTGTP